jgi:alpha-L-arabinofuranosidase
MKAIRRISFAMLLGAVSTGVLSAADTSSAKVLVHADQAKDKIDRNIYGHFSEHLGRCIYEGIWVGEDSPIPNTRGIRNDVVAALRDLRIPVLRWPGGCFADEYHWRDGLGPRERRPTMINTHWGGVTENNHFGTHEFLDLCAQLDCEPYICGNVGSGTVQEMQQWVEYITFPGVSPMADERKKNGREQPWKLKYFGVGNENWGCGGNMTAEYYADQYKRYATYVRNFGDNRIFKIACGPNGFDYKWTEVMMREAGRRMNGLALHYYCGSGKKSRSATRFDEEDWFFQLKNALRMEELLTKHSEIMDQYDRDNRVALIVDEWGAWHAVEPGTNPGFLYQQNSLRDALVAASTLNIFNNHARRVKMANIAQTINVLQSMILTDKEKIVLTPTYHAFHLYKVHHDAKLLPTEVQTPDYTLGNDKIPAVNVSASQDGMGKIHLTFCNLDPNKSMEVICELQGAKATKATGRLLTASEITSHNTFQNPENVKPTAFDSLKLTDAGATLVLPAKSAVLLEFE